MELDELATIREIIKTIKHVKMSKAAEVDRIPPEIWKHGNLLRMHHHVR